MPCDVRGSEEAAAQASSELLGAARRVPLSRDAAAMSLGHFLEVSFGAHHLSVGSRPLHAGYARYFGRGNAVACFLWERVGPVQVPPCSPMTPHMRAHAGTASRQ